MKPALPQADPAPVPLTPAQRRIAAIAAGRATRSRNRELLRQRELQREEGLPGSALIKAVTLLLCGVFFVPVFGLGYWVFELFNTRLGWRLGAWIFACVGSVWLAGVVYRGPWLLKSTARDIVGVFTGRKRDRESFWWGLAFLVGMTILMWGSFAKASFF